MTADENDLDLDEIHVEDELIEPPEPVEKGSATGSISGCFWSIVAGGGLMVLLTGLAPTCTHGATRSVRLEWERRKAAVAEAVQEAQDAEEAPHGKPDAR
jgi:hypothetical protein